jgi:hypothetical protein
MLSVPVREPIAVGIKRTSILQDFPDATERLGVQVLVDATMKSPPARILEIVNVVFWLFVSLIV